MTLLLRHSISLGGFDCLSYRIHSENHLQVYYGYLYHGHRFLLYRYVLFTDTPLHILEFEGLAFHLLDNELIELYQTHLTVQFVLQDVCPHCIGSIGHVNKNAPRSDL